jgi:hypothetical protein
VFLAHYSCELPRDTFPFRTNYLRTQVLGELEILAQGSPIVGIFIGAGVHIDHKQIAINTVRHPRRTGN